MYIHADGSGVLGTYRGPHGPDMGQSRQSLIYTSSPSGNSAAPSRQSQTSVKLPADHKVVSVAVQPDPNVDGLDQTPPLTSP